MFPDACLVRDMQKELDCLIQTGVAQLTRLLINSETGVSSGTSKAVEAEENRHVPNLKKTPYFRKIFYGLFLFHVKAIHLFCSQFQILTMQ